MHCDRSTNRTLRLGPDSSPEVQTPVQTPHVLVPLTSDHHRTDPELLAGPLTSRGGCGRQGRAARGCRQLEGEGGSGRARRGTTACTVHTDQSRFLMGMTGGRLIPSGLVRPRREVYLQWAEMMISCNRARWSAATCPRLLVKMAHTKLALLSSTSAAHSVVSSGIRGE